MTTMDQSAAMKALDTVDRTAVEQRQPVAIVLSQLDSSLDELALQLDRLATKLEPALAEQEPFDSVAPTHGGLAVGSSTVTTSIGAHACRVDALTERIMRLTTRVEV